VDRHPVTTLASGPKAEGRGFRVIVHFGSARS
jgi:hypothetical protein